MRFYMQTQHTGGLEILINDHLSDGDAGSIDGVGVAGYGMGASFGTDSNGDTLNNICQDYTGDSSQRYWVQEWGYQHFENLEKNEYFVVMIRTDTATAYDNYAMIYDISVECDIQCIYKLW